MNIVTAIPITQYWAYPADIAVMFGYKYPTKILASFREFCDSRPNYFNPATPYLENGEKQYNVLCFAHYYEHRKQLDAGSRSVSFQKDLPRLREAYGLHLIERENV